MPRRDINIQQKPRINICSPSFSANAVLVEELRSLCPGLTVNDAGERFSGDSLIEYLKNAEIAIIGTEIFEEKIIKALPSLKFVAKYGVGTDNIDIEVLQKRNIGFGWKGGVNKRSVSEMTLCFLIGLFRNIFYTSFQLKAGEWNKQGGVQLSGKTIGIIGCGFVGSDLVDLLKPFACKILINDIVDKSGFVYEQKNTGVDIETVSLEALLKKSDAVSLHIPLNGQTRNLVDDSFLNSMRNDAFLINTSRGGLINQDALKSALQKKIIAGAALDVFDEEPPGDMELLQLPNLMLSPHIGGNADEAVLAMGRSAIDGVREYLQQRVS